MLQQPALAVEAAAEAGELPARAHDAVAGDDDREGVLAGGGADGAGGAGVAEPARQLAVARGRAVGNGADGVPHAPLKRRTDRIERQLERRAAAGEIVLQLAPRPGEQRARGAAAVVLNPPRPLGRGRAVAGGEAEPADGGGGEEGSAHGWSQL